MSLLAIWLVYTFCGVGLFSVIFVWAVRSGQFADQNRARYLPLEYPELASPPDPLSEAERGGAQDRRAARRVMLAPYALLFIGAAVIVGTAIFVFTR